MEKDINVIGNYNPSGHNASRIVDSNGLSPTVMENHGTVTATNVSNLRIRKLTPKECWRLMGFDDSDFEKAEKVNSNTQLYKQAGNSIVVNVLERILENLIDKNEHIRILELFGGIGACSKALERLFIDYEIADYVEIDKYAVKSFNAIHNTSFDPQDITKWDKYIEVDLVMHGSPCQDFSLSGKQAGGDEGSGTRSSLMYETLRIVKKLKPKYVIWENVKNLLSKKHKHNFDAYLEIMESLGYKNYYQVLNAKDYGIPQNRERVFTVSILNDNNFQFPKGNGCDNKIKMIEIPQEVKVRKYEVDTEKLKQILREHKKYTNKEIANKLNKPLTLVEHWFRNDDCFSIPDADVWYNLKELLEIKTNEFDKGITEFEIKDGVYEKSNRVYLDEGLAPTITSTSANEKIIQTFKFPPKQELKLKLKDMLEDEVDEKYYLSEQQINSIKASTFHQNNRRIQEKQYVDTLCARDWKDPKCVGVTRKYGIFDTEKYTHQAGSVYDKNGLSPTLDTMQGGYRQPCIEEPKILDDRDKGFGVKISDICPTQRATRSGLKVIESLKIKNATKQGYLEATEGDGIDISSRMQYHRGNVQKDMCQTITTSGGNDRGVVIKNEIDLSCLD